MRPEKNLLRSFVREYPFQPATAFWRAVEIGHLLDYPIPAGLGLDLGCGDGMLTRIVLEHTGHRDLVGIDIDPLETAVAQHTGIYKRIHTVAGNTIPEEDNTFEFVLSNSVLEHIADIGEVLAEVARVLKPAGQFLFTVPSDKFHACLRGPLLPRVTREAYLEDLDQRLAHRRYYSKTDWQKALECHGMVIERCTGYLNSAEVRRWETISRLTAGVLYTVFRRKRQPIDVQRTLGLKKPGMRLPKLLAAWVAGIINLGMNVRRPAAKELLGCLLVVARKI